MKDYSFYNRAIELDPKNAGKYYAGRAVLYFYDMEYELAWNDFQKAIELGEYVLNIQQYKMLMSYKHYEESKQTDFSNVTRISDFYRYVNYFLLKQDFDNVLLTISRFKKDKLTSSAIQTALTNAGFYFRKCEIMKKVKENPEDEMVYWDRIKFYIVHQDIFDNEQKIIYRQRIKQDYEKLEKITVCPIHLNIHRSKYYENNNELKYAIKYCKKALELAQEKKKFALTYIIAVILKTLYVKNNDYNNAMAIAVSLIEIKPSPEAIVRQIRKSRRLVNFPCYSFPKEIEKYDRGLFEIKNYKRKCRANQKNPRLAIFGKFSY